MHELGQISSGEWQNQIVCVCITRVISRAREALLIPWKAFLSRHGHSTTQKLLEGFVSCHDLFSDRGRRKENYFLTSRPRPPWWACHSSSRRDPWGYRRGPRTPNWPFRPCGRSPGYFAPQIEEGLEKEWKSDSFRRTNWFGRKRQKSLKDLEWTKTIKS